MASTTSSRSHDQVQQDCWNDWNNPASIHHHATSFSTPMRAMEGKPSMIFEFVVLFCWEFDLIIAIVQLVCSRPAAKNSITITGQTNNTNKVPAHRFWCKRLAIKIPPSRQHRRHRVTITSRPVYLHWAVVEVVAQVIPVAIHLAWPKKNDRVDNNVDNPAQVRVSWKGDKQLVRVLTVTQRQLYDTDWISGNSLLWFARPGTGNKETTSRQIDRSQCQSWNESALGWIQRTGHRNDCHQGRPVSESHGQCLSTEQAECWGLQCCHHPVVGLNKIMLIHFNELLFSWWNKADVSDASGASFRTGP